MYGQNGLGSRFESFDHFFEIKNKSSFKSLLMYSECLISKMKNLLNGETFKVVKYSFFKFEKCAFSPFLFTNHSLNRIWLVSIELRKSTLLIFLNLACFFILISFIILKALL